MLAPGQKLRVVKFVAYAWAGARSLTAVRDQVWTALTAARQARPRTAISEVRRRAVPPANKFGELHQSEEFRSNPMNPSERN